MKFKVDDILICKKTSIPHNCSVAEINNQISVISNNQDWRPNIHLLQGVEYIVISLDKSDIMVAMRIQWYNRDKDEIYSEVEFFGFEDTRVNHWEKWFYTKAELRERKLKLLGI
jgi:hypothetical protein